MDREIFIALRERVIAADGPDETLDRDLFWHLEVMPFGRGREIDAERQQDVGWGETKDWRSLGPYFYGTLPGLTASIDAALALVERVLPGWDYGFDIFHDDKAGEPKYRGYVGSPANAEHEHWVCPRGGASAALAILAALLSALIAKETAG